MQASYKQSGMSEIYLHQIFAGHRNPSRNRLLCLCYGLSASIDETQELLKLSGMAQLYPKRKRDAIIYYGLLHKEKPLQMQGFFLWTRRESNPRPKAYSFRHLPSQSSF